ncbi:MAG: UDP-N-acetylmuramoyl-L-alanine--D-glutamate ligase, partial [Pseudomonadales bacterium]|nr:UDP-N-acetylmuramoyl-L-alanine--D-glutamate ligase [Pseudomonadales bacterium]
MNLIQTDKRRLIVGLGVTGKSCIRHFLRMGLSFSVLDTRENPPEMQAVAQEFPQVDIHLGKSHTALVDEADEIYLSPGIAIDDPLLTEAVSRGALVTGDIDLFAQQATAPVIAISGSNAKSTVTTLVGEMAKCANITAGVGGNLGEPVLDLLSSDCEAYVLELSSFQLERCADLKPQVACLLNISADHMDRHQTMMTYHQAKQRVYRGAKHIIFNRHDSLTAPLKTVDVSVKSFGLDTPDLGHYGVREIEGQRYLVKGFEPLMAVSDIPLVGDHHILNTLAAFAIGEAAGFALPAMQMAVKQFKGLPHRCEFVADIDGVDYINDSKATNVGATVAALKGLSGSTAGHIVLIA